MVKATLKMKPFSHQTLSQTRTDKGHRTTEEANVATEDIEDREVVGEVNLMQKEEEWSVTTIKKKAISLQTVALEFEMKSNHMLMWQNPRKTRKITTLACKALLKIEMLAFLSEAILTSSPTLVPRLIRQINNSSSTHSR
jgi:hypothetical protein